MDKFNKVYTNFLKFISNLDSKSKWNIKIISDDIGRRYLYDFIELNLPHMDEISSKNMDAIKYKLEDAQIVKGVNFYECLKVAYLKHKEEDLWKYLHSLYILASSGGELIQIIEKRYNNDEKYLSVIGCHECIIQNISNYMLPENNSENNNTNKNSSGKKVNKNSNDNNKNSNDDNKNSDEDDDEDDDNEDDDEENEEDTKKNMENMFGMFEDSQIGKLAKEMADEFEEKDFENIKNPADILSMFTNPNAEGGNKLADIMTKVTSKMQNKMENGEINQNQLMDEAQKLMMQMGANAMTGGAGGNNLMNMMQNMQGGGRQQRRKRKIKVPKRRY